MSYRDDVLNVLIKMPLTPSSDNKNPNPKPIKKENKSYQEFVDTVKWIIDAECDLALGFEIEFSNDYSSIKKKEHLPCPILPKKSLSR